MDFLTTVPYWGILLVVIINAWIVSKMNVDIKEEEEE